jgi:3-oxoacyl-[acyl-carrier protein] reductase/2-hydroxycyclohexanecarboxyl-CoA dehydrogenase
VVDVLVSAGFHVVAGVRSLDRGQNVLDVVPADAVSLVEIDVTDTGSVQAACETAISGGGLDAVVNNAGYNSVQPFADTEEGFWRKIVDINLMGAIRVCRYAFPLLRETGGSVVNVTSESGSAGTSGEVVYSAAKAGLSGLTRALAREWARYGIRVNAVSPGPTETAMLLDMVGGDAELYRRRVDKMIKAVPLRRLGEPREIAAAVGFLVSDAAAFMTGQVVHVGGGVTMHD